MSTETPGKPFRCWQCHSDLLPPVERCWLCGARIPSINEPLPSPSPPVIQEVERGKFQFTIASLLALTTFTAVILSIWSATRTLGIVVAIIAVPAFLWTVCLTHRYESRGVQVLWETRLVLFFRACLFIVAVPIVALIVCSALSVAFEVLVAYLVRQFP